MDERRTPLFFACLNGNVQIVEYLLQIISKRLGKEEMVRSLNGASKHGLNTNLLACAAGEGHVEVVSYLLSFKETDVNMGDKDGTTPLHFASGMGHLEVVKVSFYFIPRAIQIRASLSLKNPRRYPKEKT